MRWSARLPGAQRRTAPQQAGERSPGPADASRAAAVPTARPGPRTEAPAGHAPGDGTPRDGTPVPGHPGPPGRPEPSVHDVLAHIPALVAVTYGPQHHVGHVNHAYTEVFGPRPSGAPAVEAMPELTELGLLPLMDQVLRSRRPRTVKARRVVLPTAPDRHRYYSFVCAPVRAGEPLGAQLSALATGAAGAPGTPGGPAAPGGRGGSGPQDARHGHGALGLLTARRRAGTAAAAADDGDVAGVLIFGAEVTDQMQVAERLRESERRHREAAVTLQRSLLPQKLEQPDDLRVAAIYQPGGADAAVGGDWYDVITLGGGRTALVIGDVMGRGMRAAAVMGQLRTAVRAYARLDLPPHEVLQLLDGLAMEIDATQIATCLYAVFDPDDNRITYSSAGHLPLMIREPDGTVTRADDQCGPPLGTGGWLHTSGSVPFSPGATGVLYTDGLVERRGEDIDVGLDMLDRTLAGPAGPAGPPDVLCSRLLRAMGVTPEHDDDVAVLAFQLPQRDEQSADLFRAASLDLIGTPQTAARARAFTTGVLSSWRLGDELRDLGVLAVSELVSNSLTHGAPPMRLRIRRTDRRLIVEVTDADDHLPRRRRAASGDESGRGVAIVATIASSWGTRRTPDGGKAVWCEFLLPTNRAL
ncbi:SpoIIE family protein phosphatase [Streptomyces sp. NPDC001380]|uniref:ATP-binding SpoIIE family protein phosphatase n=1 Tax=Streptomyces sp. NPDC001380 TaxID=3364566 RepID=UPI00369FB22C